MKQETFTALTKTGILIEQRRKDYNQILHHSDSQYGPTALENVVTVIVLLGLT